MSAHASASTREATSGRCVGADIDFAIGGGRTILARQITPYPFHVTRPFRLDRDPEVSTLYLQSASGGLYRGDDLTLRLRAKRGAHAHVTTQAATVVHNTGALPARQRTFLALEDDAFLAYTPDPLVLFPGAAMVAETRVVLAPTARCILVDGFAWHDPANADRPFDALIQRLEIVDDHGRPLVRERGGVAGAAALAPGSPLGPFRASGSMVVLAPRESLQVSGALQRACEATGCLAGVSILPNGAGLILRCLGDNGGTIRGGLEAAFRHAFAALVGSWPAARRK